MQELDEIHYGRYDAIMLMWGFSHWRVGIYVFGVVRGFWMHSIQHHESIEMHITECYVV